MKNIEKLIQLKDSHKIYFNCSCVNALNRHLKFLAYDKERTIPALKNDMQDKILILAYLTSIHEIESKIIFSNEYKVNDHCNEGAKNNMSCITAFIHCQDVKLEEELEKLAKELSR